LDKCKSGIIKHAIIDPEDIVITHFLKLPENFKVKKHVLSCHETNLFPLKDMDLSRYHSIHYVSEWQRQWHGVEHPYKVIPAMIDKVEWKDPNNKTAGVVGSIDAHKRTHMSIERALQDGYSAVKLFGVVTDPVYYSNNVEKYVSSGEAKLMGFMDKMEMYNQVCKVYSSSKRECLPLIQGECLYANIPFEGLECNMRSESDYEFDDSKILSMWEDLLSE
jgi:hypothetical protein